MDLQAFLHFYSYFIITSRNFSWRVNAKLHSGIYIYSNHAHQNCSQTGEDKYKMTYRMRNITKTAIKRK